MIKLKELTNQRIISIGEEKDIAICGSERSILWDGDLEEVLDSLGISFSDTFYINEPEFGDSSEIINYEEGELMGYALLTQEEEKTLVPIIASSIACSEINEQLNFNDVIKGGK